MRKRTDFYGNLGDIWAYSDSEYRAVLLHRNGDETLHRFPPSDLQRWLNKLEVPANQSLQRKFANAFPATSEDVQRRFEASKINKIQKTKYLKVKDI